MAKIPRKKFFTNIKLEKEVLHYVMVIMQDFFQLIPNH